MNFPRQLHAAIAVIFFLLLVWRINFAQAPAVNTLVDAFGHYRNNAFTEKVYVHLSQNFFLTGETLWFKIYAVDGTFHQPLDLSKVGYVELLDKNNMVVVEAKIRMEDGSGNGSLFIPATLASGNYLLRAYTHWMKNQSPEFYFQKTVTIVNPFIKTDQVNVKTGAVHRLDFFPEGGNLVSGIESRVGFKVTDLTGKGIVFTGHIIDDGGDTITHFRPDRFGIGSFVLPALPQAGYRAIIRDSDGIISTHAFPPVHEHGMVMRVEPVGENLSVKVMGKLMPNQVPLVYVFVHTRQEIIKAEAQFLRNNEAIFSIPLRDLGAGISHVTIFDSDYQPMCERLFFKQPEKRLGLSMAVSRKEYGVRQRVSVNIELDSLWDCKAGLSVSVSKVDSLDSGQQGEFYSYLWLTSDLVGPIESPASYLEARGPAAQHLLDNLMLTHGWRRFRWEDVTLRKTKARFIPEYRGHVIHANIYGRSGIPAGGVTTVLSSPRRQKWLYSAISSKAGDLLYDVKNLHGPRRLIFQPDPAVDSSFVISLRRPFSDEFASQVLPPFWINPTLEKSLLARSISMQVEDVYRREPDTTGLAEPFDSVSFYGAPDAVYALDDYTRFPVMEEVLREYVPSVLIRKRKDDFYFTVADKLNGGAFQEPPLVLLDGVPVRDLNSLMQFDPLRVQKLDVLAQRFYLNSLSFAGIVSFSTYSHDLSGFNLGPGTISINYEGLQAKREFRMPAYHDVPQRMTRLPDQRSLLFWSPEIRIDKAGKGQLDFFTSDVVGNFRITVEGIDAAGRAGTVVETFSVVRNDH